MTTIRFWISIFLSIFSASALRFEIAATQGQGTVRCIEQTMHSNTLVRGEVDIPSRAFQTVDVLVRILSNSSKKNDVKKRLCSR